MSSLYAVIMAGGTGTRLWPESRQKCPKQFLSFYNDKTLLALTAERILPLIPWERILVVTGQEFARQVEQLLPCLPKENILLEPCSRNTAPCICLAAMELLERSREATMLVLAADHYISPSASFLHVVEKGMDLLDNRTDLLITFGITPTGPRTIYGYIKRGAPLNTLKGCISSAPQSEAGPFWVEQFTEKPSAEKALNYLETGLYLWNSGIFLWKAHAIMEDLVLFEPELGMELLRLRHKSKIERNAVYPSLKSISIDYAVMEQARNVVVFPCSFHWNDLGSYRALDDLEREEQGIQEAQANTANWGTELLTVEAYGNQVRRRTTLSGQHLTVLLGVNDLIVVETEDITLVAQKGEEDKIKKVLQQLQSKSRMEYL